MGSWIKDTMTTGTVVAAATTAAAALLGRAENGSAVAPVNAISHMLYGEDEDTGEHADVKHTLAGVGLNAMAVTGWAGVHELFMPRTGKPTVSRAVLVGTATAAAAYITDYHVVPKRLTPGFEKRLSGPALFGIFATLAISLAAASLYRGRTNATP